MRNGKESPISHLSRAEILKGVLHAPEVEGERWFLDANLSKLFFLESKRIINRWGNKKRRSAGEYFETEPIRIWVENEKVELIISSGAEKDKEDFAILARINDQPGDDLSVLFSVKSEFTLPVRNANKKGCTSEELCLAFKLLAFMDRSLSRESAKKHL